MTSLFLLTAACFTGCVCLHWLLVRLIARTNFVRNGFIFICFAGIALLPVALRQGVIGFVFFYLNLAILWNLYTIFFINLMNSVSLRMLTEIARSHGGSLSSEEIAGVYSDEEAFESRVRGLVAAGFLESRGPDLILTRKGACLARLLVAIRAVFGIRSYG